MDALPVQEETGLPFASENEGVAHACGHDGHIAILLGTAKVLGELREHVNGEVRFVDRKSTRLNSSHATISYAVFCLKKNTSIPTGSARRPSRTLPNISRVFSSSLSHISVLSLLSMLTLRTCRFSSIY